MGLGLQSKLGNFLDFEIFDQISFVTWALERGLHFRFFKHVFVVFGTVKVSTFYGPVMIELDYCDNKLALSFVIHTM